MLTRNLASFLCTLALFLVSASANGSSSDLGLWSYHGDGVREDYWWEVWPGCAGRRQSPIDIDTSLVVRKPPGFLKGWQKVGANTAHVWFNDTGHDLRLFMNELDMIVIGSSFDYVMQVEDIHFHSRSEHMIDGKDFALELQVITSAADQKDYEVSGHYGHVAISILFEAKERGSDPLLSQLVRILTANTNLSASTNGKNILDFSVEVRPALDFSGDFFEYEGSLTAPPCTEAVHWLVATDPRPASKEQLDVFEAALRYHDGSDNRRQTQILNGRRVYRRAFSESAVCDTYCESRSSLASASDSRSAATNVFNFNNIGCSK